MGYLPGFSCVHTTIRVHHIDINKIHTEKSKWEQNKNAACCLEQIQDESLNKATIVWLPTSHLTKKQDEDILSTAAHEQASVG